MICLIGLRHVVVQVSGLSVSHASQWQENEFGMHLVQNGAAVALLSTSRPTVCKSDMCDLGRFISTRNMWERRCLLGVVLSAETPGLR